MKTAVFPGTFDPFTVGHANVVERGLRLFDRIVIGVGVNDTKTPDHTAEERADAIRKIYAGEPRVGVQTYSDLTIDLCRREQAGFIIRGVRSMKDFEYERDVAAVNSRLSDVETVLIFSDEELAYLSSSIVRELQKYGKDVSEFLP